MNLCRRILFILLTVSFVMGTFLSSVSALQMPADPVAVEEAQVVIEPIKELATAKPIFFFHSKAFEICRFTKICGPGNYKDFIPIRTLIIFKGNKKSRFDKSSIMWEVKFLEYAPAKITYSEVPYNGRETVKSKPLVPGEDYTLCVYPKESGAICSKWSPDI